MVDPIDSMANRESAHGERLPASPPKCPAHILPAYEDSAQKVRPGHHLLLGKNKAVRPHVSLITSSLNWGNQPPLVAPFLPCPFSHGPTNDRLAKGLFANDMDSAVAEEKSTWDVLCQKLQTV